MSGLFVTFEGGEGGGKTTQLKLTEAWLRSLDYPVTTTREPGGTELGQKIRALLLQGGEVSNRAELLLLMADRAHHVETCIQPHLDRGFIVLCDRYYDSTIAYQGYGRGMDLDAIARINGIATNGLQPDVTLWLDLEVSVGLARAKQVSGNPDRMERLDLEFHQRVVRGFRELAMREGDRIVRVDGSQSSEAVQAEIQTILKPYLK
ncbi:dTMP kinase [Pseudanabaena sp. PCC 6802]|uniref:dTMP kinase n=1 Tax=Pseudanabaena sp. PCC 6802 TaxID=118173 RepID=UPI00034D2152|nr:dTMP kinase [Pseudanabaena sp. PCC 6802]